MSSGGVVRLPAIPPPVRIRQNINNLSTSDPIVVYYGKAIDAMRAKPISDPLSWRYQAAIHDYPYPDDTYDQRRINPNDPSTVGRDPFATDGETLPADRLTYWRQCQHNTWFFLPWHRMYLHHFEKIVLNQVVQLGGPKDWALPYWKWDATDGDGRIPVALRNPANGGLATLSFPPRNTAPNANNGEQIADATNMDKAFLCLKPTQFTGNDKFGGPAVRRHAGQGRTVITPPDPNPVPPDLDGMGVLEGVPHGSMHVRTGGSGWMSRFTQAALDPIFWLHHCNIDRLWEVWIQRKSGFLNPDDNAWLDASFAFHDATGGNGNLTPRQVVQTRLPPLSYEYDDLTDPLKGA